MASEFKHEGCETGQIRKVYHLILLQRRRREKGLIRTKKKTFFVVFIGNGNLLSY